MCVCASIPFEFEGGKWDLSQLLRVFLPTFDCISSCLMPFILLFTKQPDLYFCYTKYLAFVINTVISQTDKRRYKLFPVTHL